MIAPSILAADFARLGEQVLETETAGANRVHVDVMDGHFVPNLSMGAVVCEGLRPVTRMPLEVHLMVEEPTKFFDGFIKAGADAFIFHLEVVPEPTEVIRHLRGLGKRVGLAVNPDFDLRNLEPWIEEIDLALCMTVFPGFGGQSFIPESLDRIRTVRGWINKRNPKCELEIDGGVNAKTIGAAAAAGANVFVAGSAVFCAPGGPAAGVKQLAELATKG